MNQEWESQLGELISKRGALLCTAESCTGGLLASKITEIAGSSDWFAGGWVTYSNLMKVNQLGVPFELISRHGAVSWQVARAMCAGAIAQSDAVVSLSTTGIAGPSGGTENKPVGTVFIGCQVDSKSEVREFRFQGTRQSIRAATVATALQMACAILLSESIEEFEHQVGAPIA